MRAHASRFATPAHVPRLRPRLAALAAFGCCGALGACAPSAGAPPAPTPAVSVSAAEQAPAPELASAPVPAPVAPAHRAVPRDLDGDGRPDDITVTSTGGAHCCGELHVRLTRCGRALDLPFLLDDGAIDPADPDAGASALGDFDGDGAEDLFVETHTYNGEAFPLPPALEALGARTNYLVASFTSCALRVRDTPLHPAGARWYLEHGVEHPEPPVLRFEAAGAFGYRDARGRVVVPATLLRAGVMAEGRAVVSHSNTGTDFWIIDERGVVVGPILPGTRLGYMRHSLSVVDDAHYVDGRLLAEDGDAHPLYLGRDGRIAIAARAGRDDARPFSEGLAAVADNGLWGFIRPDGTFAVPPRFAYASAFEGGEAFVSLAGKSYVLAQKTFALLPPPP